MTEEAKEKLESRKAALQAEFDKLTEDFKTVQGEIAAKQRQLASIRENQLRIQGAFQELNNLAE